ncbi:MAG TPA: penicillin-binding protein 2 [Verrucomicrobiae bacterium]|nr:penicillin-binding protein 2 [Verrucomicrobiae bacterium]
MNPFEYYGLKRTSKASKQGVAFEETLVDAGAEDRAVLDDEREQLNYRLIGLALLFVFLVIFGRLYNLQAIRGDEYRALAEGNKSRTQYLLAPRGLIVDNHGKVIVGNVPSFELVAIPGDLPTEISELEKRLTEIAGIIGKEVSELQALVSKMDRSTYQAQTLAQNLTKDAALTLIARRDEFKGFSVQNNPIRDYKDPIMYSHLVGYTGKITEEELKEKNSENYLLNDYIGKTGLEVQYENFLRGIPGQKPSEIDAVGNFKKSLPEIPPQPGKNIRLNIDYDLQKTMYDSLTAIMQKFNKSKAAAVATDPKTGRVLAFISLPGFDNNWFARGISSNEYSSLLNDQSIPLLNRAISGTYPPGSTVKPMLAQAALTEGIVDPNTKILDDGVIRIGEYSFYGYERSGLGIMDVYSAIARSSDIYFYTIGGGNAKTVVKEGLGPEKLAEWYRKFHVGTKLGIDLPNEKDGLVPDPDWKLRVRNEPWYLGNTYHYSIGQGDLLVTPLQVNSWTATIANGGKIMRPFILNEVAESTGKIVHKEQPKVINENFLDQKWLKVVQDGMRQTVTAGSARSLNALPISVAGKTGTAQFISRNLTSTHAWFTAYAPFEDPQIAITVLVEEGGEGSSVAVPVVRETLIWWAANRLIK